MPRIKIPTTVKDKELVEKRREQIVLAAIKLFARSGFHKTTLRELAEEAGISHGNIYDYVGSKQDIFFLLHEFMNNLATEKTKRAVSGVSEPLEKLRRMIEAEFDLMYDWSDAILVLYQESHVLSKPLLKALLKRERERVSILEGILEECAKTGKLRDCNIRIATNLIKGMTETWVTKRWDLRGHADGKEMESAIIDLVFNGLIDSKGRGQRGGRYVSELQGRSVLILGCNSMLGKNIVERLVSDGALVSVYIGNDSSMQEMRYLTDESDERGWAGRYKLYSSEDYGPLRVELVEKILDDMGSAEVLIHDLGSPIIKNGSTGKRKKKTLDKGFNEKLNSVHLLANWVRENALKRGLKRIVYLAPWAWDQYEDPIGYEIRKSTAVSLTKKLAKDLAPESINVNCIVPGYIGGVRPFELQQQLGSDAKECIPLGRFGEIADIIRAVLFFTSADSKYVTGQVLNVSGGI